MLPRLGLFIAIASAPATDATLTLRVDAAGAIADEKLDLVSK